MLAAVLVRAAVEATCLLLFILFSGGPLLFAKSLLRERADTHRATINTEDQEEPALALADAKERWMQRRVR